jgi:LytTr DNA-binding domain
MSSELITKSAAGSAIRYNDFWIKIIGCLIASEIIDSLGREESIFQRLTSSYFYIDLLSGFIIALILWEIIRFVTRKLDLRYDWFENSVQRISLQIIFGILAPAFLCFIFTLLFMRLAYNQDIFKTQWLHNEFYAVILIIIIVNLVYFTWSLFYRWKSANTLAIGNDSHVRGQNAPVINSNTTAPPAVTEVSKADKNILLPHAEIAYVVLDGSYTFIKTQSGESFVTTYTLDELAKTFDPFSFFRINRQIIINRQSCKSYKSIENGKISVELYQNGKLPVIVSQKRAKDFRKWIGGSQNISI